MKHYNQEDYGFNRPKRGKNYTRWMLVLRFLLLYGLSPKKSILDAVWGEGNYGKPKGAHSHLFGCMRGFGLIDYSSQTKKWLITTKGIKTYFENKKD